MSIYIIKSSLSIPNLWNNPSTIRGILEVAGIIHDSEKKKDNCELIAQVVMEINLNDGYEEELTL